ncbi:hypothetical protein G7Y89_g8720 [Cudoniella acicularis]|uniref:Uncharacterized protein n=1 Tax=Cudoniella acicularis TaxID=354080 RepID=A0A8H4W0U3_9HELO|nr:hypothetical protein G7Y89_g8720 [Cudoniella acicularis]
MSAHSSENHPCSHGEKPVGSHNELSRQMTVTLSPDQYERLFFQPSAAKGDLAKRLGNPTLLALLGFLIPFSSTVFSLLQFQGSSASSLTSVSGTFLFFGGIAMNIAGICEFILGNTFPFVVFIVYGCHWVNLGYLFAPVQGVIASYAADGVPGALSQAHNAGDYQLGMNPTAAGLEHALYYYKIAGGFGFVAMIMGWYLAIITACASTGVPCPLPVFDLSTKVFPHNTEAQKGEHAGTVTEMATRA